MFGIKKKTEANEKKPVYVVTGGANGIGLAAAKALGDGVVVISDINEKALDAAKETLESLGVQTVTAVCDISDKAKVDELAKTAASLGEVKGVVHSAGVSGDCGSIELVLKVDLIGALNVIESFHPVMGSGSSMVVVSSMMADTIRPNPEQDAILADPRRDGLAEALSPYCTDPNQAYDVCKRGCRLLCQKWASAFGEKGARINTVSPGVIMTEMARKAAEEHPEQMGFMKMICPLHRNGEPEEIASVIKFLLGDASSFVTGTDIKADGGVMNALIAYKMKAAAQAVEKGE